jgi:hypothetical protein
VSQFTTNEIAEREVELRLLPPFRARTVAGDREVTVITSPTGTGHALRYK